jgi:hypothetical protein
MGLPSPPPDVLAQDEAAAAADADAGPAFDAAADDAAAAAALRDASDDTATDEDGAGEAACAHDSAIGNEGASAAVHVGADGTVGAA